MMAERGVAVTGRYAVIVGLAVAALLVLIAILARHGMAPLPGGDVHAVMALGMLPLILAVMAFFVPVLTRTVPTGHGGLYIPLMALSAGALALAGMSGAPAWIPVAAGVGLLSVVAMAAWVQGCVRRALGPPHPGLAWYQAALALLALALAAVLAGAWWPAAWPALRRLHLHLNLLGFVGVTAIGTLQVLLPTAGGYADAQAAQRLRGGWRYAVAGTALIAAGAAWYMPLVWPGLVCWLFVLVPLGLTTLRHVAAWRAGAGAALASALLGYVALLLFGMLHALGVMDARASVVLFILMFLLPLLTGALNQLTPVWLLPTADTAAQAAARRALARTSGVRALGFPLCGGLWLAGMGWAVYPAVGLLGVFLAQLAWLVVRSMRK
jgi:hypothetical protein